MKAILYTKYGPPDVLELREIERPIIDRRYMLSEVAEAVRYYGEGHTRGKVIITVDWLDF